MKNKLIVLAAFLLLHGMVLHAQPPGRITVSGTITDTSGEPLPGASVVLKGSGTGVMSDADGVYKFEFKPKAGEKKWVLVYGFVSMESKEVTVTGSCTMDVSLRSDSTLDEVIVNDDVAVDGSLYTVGRRGVAGTVFVHKITGAKAETGASLEEVKATAQKVIDNVRTMSMAIKPCTVPAAGKPGFELGEDEMEIGIGIHGEPGTHREALKPADEIVDMMMDKILADIDFSGEVAVMINSCGGTPLMELFIVNNHVNDILAAKGIKVYKTFVGEFMTSLEMEGFSITLLKLDDELKALLDAPADTPAFKVI